jgi:hypothetical protein
MGGISGLPSWVVDWTQVQSLAISVMSSDTFSADQGFPPVAREPRLDDREGSCVLTLRGICVAVITGTILSTPVTGDGKLAKENRIRLIRYDTDLALRDNDSILHDTFRKWQPLAPGTEMTPKVSCYNTTWAPRFCSIGDIIIVSPGSREPLVLRKIKGAEEGTKDSGYVFLGLCWMIDGQIKDMNKLATDPGMSKFMLGKGCEGLPESYKAEIFRIH